MGKPANVVIKLDMAKAYDRVNWKFLINVMEMMGFDGDVLDLVWRILANNCYSILINGQPMDSFILRGVLNKKIPYLLHFSFSLQKYYQKL